MGFGFGLEDDGAHQHNNHRVELLGVADGFDVTVADGGHRGECPEHRGGVQVAKGRLLFVDKEVSAAHVLPRVCARDALEGELHLEEIWRRVDPGGKRVHGGRVVQRRDGEPVPEAADLVRG